MKSEALDAENPPLNEGDSLGIEGINSLFLQAELKQLSMDVGKIVKKTKDKNKKLKQKQKKTNEKLIISLVELDELQEKKRKDTAAIVTAENQIKKFETDLQRLSKEELDLSRKISNFPEEVEETQSEFFLENQKLQEDYTRLEASMSDRIRTLETENCQLRALLHPEAVVESKLEDKIVTNSLEKEIDIQVKDLQQTSSEICQQRKKLELWRKRIKNADSSFEWAKKWFILTQRSLQAQELKLEGINIQTQNETLQQEKSNFDAAQIVLQALFRQKQTLEGQLGNARMALYFPKTETSDYVSDMFSSSLSVKTEAILTEKPTLNFR